MEVSNLIRDVAWSRRKRFLVCTIGSIFSLGSLGASAFEDERGRPSEGARPSRIEDRQDLGPPAPPTDMPPGPGRPEFGPPGPWGRLGGPPMWSRLSEEERERIRTFMKENFPAVFEELEQLRAEQRERFEARIRRVVPEMWELMDMLEIDPERASLLIRERRIDMDLRRLGMRFRFAVTDEERGRILESMHALASEAFEVRHQREAIEIRDIETRLQELKARHARAEQERGSWIEEHLRRRMEAPAEFDRAPFPRGDDGPPPARRGRTP